MMGFDMTLQEARNEIRVREEEIASIDRQIAELEDKIKERQEDWDFERKQREQDPNWRIAALDYIQKGDRGGLESYTTNRLMAEQSLVDRINGFDVEYMNLTRDEAQRNNRINQLDIALARNDLSATERTEFETQKANLESELDTIRQMKKNVNAKKESAIDFYERRYGKSRSQRKFGNKVETKVKDTVETKFETKVKDSVENNVFNQYRSIIGDYVAKIPTNYELTDEDVNEWKESMREEMKAAGIAAKDINDLLGNVKGNGLTRLQAFKNIFNWVENIGVLKFNGSPSEKEKKAFLTKLESDEMFQKLSENDQRKLTDEVNAIETSESKAKADAQGAARNDSITQKQEWNNNRNVWLGAIKSAINLNGNKEQTDKAHQDAYDAVKGNKTALMNLKSLGYTYSDISHRWSYTPKSNPKEEHKQEPKNNPSKKKLANF